MTDAKSARWIEIDDRDSGIEHSGEWFSDTYTTPGPFQAPGDLNQGTARGTNSTARLSFRYEGGNSGIWGSSSQLPTTAKIRCTLGGVGVGHGPKSNDERERWLICFADQPGVGAHGLVMEVTSTDGTIIWVDSISYFSTVNPDLKNKHSEIPVNDVAMQYFGDGWQDHPSGKNAGRFTNEGGTMVSFPFYGTSVKMLGFLQPSMPLIPSVATFSVDDGPETPFTLPTYQDAFRGLSPGTTRYRVPVLSTPAVPNGFHNIRITFHGNSTSSPLAIDYICIAHEGAVVTPSTNIGTPLLSGIRTLSSPLQSQTSSTTNRSQEPTSIGAIVGGVVGGVTFLAIVFALAFCFWRRRKRRDYSAVSPSPFELATSAAAPMTCVDPPQVMAYDGKRQTQVQNYSMRSSPGRPSFQSTPASGSSQPLSSLALGQVAPFTSPPTHPLQYPSSKLTGGNIASLPIEVSPPAANGNQPWHTPHGGMSTSPGLIFQPAREASFPPLDPPPPISPLQRDSGPFVRLDGHSKRGLAEAQASGSQQTPPADPQRSDSLPEYSTGLSEHR